MGDAGRSGPGNKALGCLSDRIGSIPLGLSILFDSCHVFLESCDFTLRNECNIKMAFSFTADARLNAESFLGMTVQR